MIKKISILNVQLYPLRYHTLVLNAIIKMLLNREATVDWKPEITYALLSNQMLETNSYKNDRK